MRSLVGTIIILLLFSCQDVKKVEKPSNLISENKMVEILTDLTVLNSAKNFNKRFLEETGIRPDSFLYEKHGIDSLQLAKSADYYARKYDLLENIYSRVKSNLEKMKIDLEKIRAEEERIEDSIRKADSLKKPLDTTGLKLIKGKVIDSLGRIPANRRSPLDSI